MSTPELGRVLRRTDFFGAVGRAYGDEWMFLVARRSERRTALITYEKLRSSSSASMVVDGYRDEERVNEAEQS